MQQSIRRTHSPRLLLAAALALAPGGAVLAQETPAWTLSGFGTLGLVHSSERHADYASSVLKANGAGASRPWSGDVDTRLGAQADLALDRRWSAVLQVVGEQRLDNRYRPQVEWANVKYQATPELALRAGRIALPVFLSADYRKIGYIGHWVRPPVESYGTMPITSSDGLDALWRWSAGPVRNASQFFAGRDGLAALRPVDGEAHRIVGMSNTSDWGALSVRVNLIRADITIDIARPLFQAFDAFGPAGQAIGARYAIDDKRFALASAGLSYDPGAWFLMAEAGGTHSASLLGSTRSLYASAGYRWGAFTPYVTASRVRAVGATRAAGLAPEDLPPPLRAQAAQLDAGLNALLATIPQQSSASAGVRWDAWRNIALKLQYDRVTPHAGSRGTMINTAPGFRSGQPAHIASLALDFVY